ncbi:unnamed protein product [Rhizoctonia solani]|uniref:Methyltransferase type 11 domain-containing protein n=1 Tax=Rhizoctonia solani TaxID=456999 RepID=A0A8H2XLY1_9AGAM|nr:unnamed protein product [Rhizoctonia solani]CAE7212192.1 unnamed protein product [Rhizoctonia solani]
MDLDGAVPLKDTWSASQYNKAASFVYSDAYTQPILELLSPHEGERILDMGCGTGELTHRLQEFVGGAGMVVGVDSSQNMLEKAWRNGVVNVFCCDIQSLIIPDKFKSLRGTFDAVFTNATLHWCKRDPSGVVRGVKHALRPGGRFVGEFGGYLNCVVVKTPCCRGTYEERTSNLTCEYTTISNVRTMPDTTREYGWSPSLYNQNAAFAYSEESTRLVFELLSLQSGERVVDMGCGTGELTLRLQQLAGRNGLALGIDASESMLEKARANGVKNLLCSDIQKLVVPEEFNDLVGTFDAIYTNATLHWCKQDPSGAVQAAKTLLKPGGRFVGELCGHMTGMGIRSAIAQVLKTRGINPPDPWFLPQPEEYTKVLEAEGFKVEHISLNPRIVHLPGSMSDFFRAIYKIAFLKDMSEEEAEKVIQEISEICQFDQKDQNGRWSYLYVPLRFRAIAPM